MKVVHEQLTKNSEKIWAEEYDLEEECPEYKVYYRWLEVEIYFVAKRF